MNIKHNVSWVGSVVFWAVPLLGSGMVSSVNPAHADRCSCPPAGADQAKPAVYEPAQRAVLLWNGTDEILVLSTDLRSDQRGPIAEVLALPAEPQVSHSSLDVFSRVVELAGATHLRRDWLPSAPMGSMGTTFLVGSWNDPSFRPGFANKCHSEIEYYRANGMPWTVFNWVDLENYTQSFPPIEYRFSSRKAFFPLRISSADLGHTQVDLVVVTRGGLTALPNLEYPIETLGRFTLSTADLATVSPAWSALFQRPTLASGPVGTSIAGSVVVEHLRIQGDMAHMLTDFVAQ